MFRLIAVLCLGLGLLPLPVLALCTGQNLIAALPAAERAALEAAASDAPFATGNVWRARRGTDQIVLIGTFHLDDPRHQATLTWLEPLIGAATRVLVEAGPIEQQALRRRIAEDPSILLSTGPTLPERLSPTDWQALSQAMLARGVSPVLVSKFQPWYVAALLAIPPCATAGSAAVAGGLDGAIISAAQAQGVPLSALEAHDTVLTLFDDISEADQLAMIQTALASEAQSADTAATLADAYFAGQSRLILEFSRLQALATPGADPATVKAGFVAMEENLILARNRAWIDGLEAAAMQGPALAAFGALHLSGQDGVLALLQRRGFVIEPLTP